MDNVSKCIVHVSSDLTVPVDGLAQRNFDGVGVIVDATRGLIACDRCSVPSIMSEVNVTF